MADYPKSAVIYLNWHKYPGDTLDTHPSVVAAAPAHDRYYPSWPLHLPADRELQWQFDAADPNRCIEGHYKEILDMIEAGVDVVLFDWWALPVDSTDTSKYPTQHSATSIIYNEFSPIALRYFVLALEKAEREGKAIPRIAPFVEYHAVAGAFDGALGSECLTDPGLSATTKWAGANGFSDTIAGNATYTHNAAGGTLTQTSADLALKPTPYRAYKFTYTISGLTPGGLVGTLPVGIAAQAVNLPMTAGTHSVTFVAAAGAATANFVISVTSTTGAVFTIDDLTLKQLPEAYEWFNAITLRFFSMVPERYLATLDDKILWTTWWWTQSDTAGDSSPGDVIECLRSAVAQAYPTYPALYCVGDVDWNDTGQTEAWWTDYNAGQMDAISEWCTWEPEDSTLISGAVRTAFPGFDRHSQHDGIQGITPRDGTNQFEYRLQQCLSSTSGVKLLRTMWNDFEESTWIARSRELDDAHMALFKQYGDNLKAGIAALPTLARPLPTKITSRPTMVGSQSIGKRWIRGRIGVYHFRTGDYVAGADARVYWGIRNQASSTNPWYVCNADWLAADLGGGAGDLSATIYADNARLPFTGGVFCIDNEWMSYSGIASNIATLTARGLYGSTRAAHTAVPVATVGKKARRATLNSGGFTCEMEPPILPPWSDFIASRPYTNKGADRDISFDLADAFTWGTLNPVLSISILHFDAVYRGYCKINMASPGLGVGGTTATVDNNADFPTGSGLLMIGTELIGYVGVTPSTAFTNLKRGLAQTTAAIHADTTPVRQVLGRCAVLDTTISSAGTTSFVLSAGHGALVNLYDYLRVDEGASHEIVQVTAIAGDTLTVVRGLGGTTALSTINAGSMLHTATGVTINSTDLTVTSMTRVGPYIQLDYGFTGFDGQYNISGAYKAHATTIEPDTDIVWDRSCNGPTELQALAASTGITAGSTTLSAGISATDGSITIAGTTGFPSAGVVLISDGVHAAEYAAYSGLTVGATTLTLTGVTRGASGSTARAWLTGDSVVFSTLSPSATTIEVDSTTGFPTAGLLRITNGTDTEYVLYSGVTATSFTGCIRQFGGYGTVVAWPDSTAVERSLWQLSEWALTDANLESLQDYSTDIRIKVRGGGSVYLMDVFAILPYDVGPNPREWGKGNRPWPPQSSAFS